MTEAEDLMQLAIRAARRGISRGQGPFGCSIRLGGEILAIAHSTVIESMDITAHAEVTALREACRRHGGIHLEGALVASTCEPCPMCMAALHWARVRVVYFGATISDAAAAGFNELEVPASELLRIGGGNVRLISGVLEPECRGLFSEWREMPSHQPY